MLFRMVWRVNKQAEQRGVKVQVYILSWVVRGKGEGTSGSRKERKIWLFGCLIGFRFSFGVCKLYGICVWSVYVYGVVCVYTC